MLLARLQTAWELYPTHLQASAALFTLGCLLLILAPLFDEPDNAQEDASPVSPRVEKKRSSSPRNAPSPLPASPPALEGGDTGLLDEDAPRPASALLLS